MAGYAGGLLRPGVAPESIVLNVDAGELMDLQIAKWGDGLALRIPSAVARQLGLRDGDTVRAQVMADGALAIRPAGWSRASFAAELEQARAALPMGSSVIDELRRGARY
jgi:antitoxin MazE